MTNTFININTLDYTGTPSISTYALSSTPLLFYPEYVLVDDEKNSVIWDFGDGTVSRQTSAYKYYSFPGEYIVSMVIYDCVNNAIISTSQKTVNIYDFLPLTFRINTTNSLSAKCGQTSEPFILTATFPVYQPPISVFYSVSGSNSTDYWEISNKKYSHLENTYNLYDKFYNNHINSYQYRDIDRMIPDTVSIFAKKENSNLVVCNSTDDGAFFVGMSGNKEFFYKDDLPSENVEIYLSFDKTNYKIPQIEGTINYLNNLGISIPFKVKDNTPSYLSITSNGLDGEYYLVDSFNISKVKFFNTQIPFVIKTKDESNFTFKNLNTIELSAITFNIFSNNDLLSPSTYSISSLNYTLSSQNMNGAFRGVLTFVESDQPLTNLRLSAVATATPFGVLSGASSEFNVYPVDFYDAYKKNEDFDGEQTLKDLIFQEILINDTNLFDEFFGSVFGDNDYDHEYISLKIYEKIANFVQNTQDLDSSELEFLDSMAKYIGYNDINEENYLYPEKIKRLVNLLSIDTTRLLGTPNKFRENFNPKGYTGKDRYGKNLGEEIDPQTYIVNPNNPIVALEKFSNTYTLLNTYQPKDLGIWEHMCAQVDSRLIGKDPLSSSYLFEPTSLSGYRPENPDSFLYGIDKTGWTSVEFWMDQGILLTPRHLGYAAHYNGYSLPPIGREFNFYDLSGNLTVGKLLSGVRIGSTDIRIIILDSDLPDTIKPVRIASNEFLNYIDWAASTDPRSRTPMVWRDRFQRAYVDDHNNSTATLLFSSDWNGIVPTDNTRLSFYKNPNAPIPGAESFDSGSPISFLFKNDAILVGHFFGGGAGSGPRYGSYLTEINNAISALNLYAGVVGDYSLNVVYPSEVEAGYPYYLRDYTSDWGWPLVLPTPFDTIDFEKYYLFFEYNNEYDNTLLDGVIDFDNIKTTIPLSATYTTLWEDGGIYDNLFLNTLYQSLSLIS